jgi:hypothetical protein
MVPLPSATSWSLTMHSGIHPTTLGITPQQTYLTPFPNHNPWASHRYRHTSPHSLTITLGHHTATGIPHPIPSRVIAPTPTRTVLSLAPPPPPPSGWPFCAIHISCPHIGTQTSRLTTATALANTPHATAPNPNPTHPSNPLVVATLLQALYENERCYIPANSAGWLELQYGSGWVCDLSFLLTSAFSHFAAFCLSASLPLRVCTCVYVCVCVGGGSPSL